MKRLLSVVMAFVLTSSPGGFSAFAADNPFEDQDVVIDTSSLYHGSEPISVSDTIADIYEVIESGIDTDSSGGQESTETDGGSIETVAAKYIGGDAASKGNEDSARLDGDAFEGGSTAFEGKNGSTTEVYENGSVLTTNGDGTKEGVDDKGTLVSVDKDGNETYHFNDGTIGIKYADGRKEQIYEDGTKLIQNSDGSLSTYELEGYYTDLDEDGNVISIYFDNGERIDIYDENGEFINQNVTITGPNGEVFTYKYDSTDDDGEYNVNEMSFSAEGNGSDHHLSAVGGGNGDYTLDIKCRDGSTFLMDADGGSVKADFSSGDGEFESHLTQTENQIALSYREGDERVDMTSVTVEDGTYVKIENSDGSGIDGKYDENGNWVSGMILSADGSYIKSYENGAEINDAKSGAYFRSDKDGSITSAHIPLESGASYDFSNGTGVLVDENNDTKVMWTHDDDGELVIVSPGGEYTVDNNGNLYKDGEPVKFKGAFVNVDKGLAPDKETTNPEEPTEEEKDAEEATEETTEPEEQGLASKRLEGTYNISGSTTFEDYELDETETYSESVEVRLDAVDEHTLVMGVYGEEYITISNYDPSTGSCSFTDEDNVVIYINFAESGGSITVTFSFDYTFDSVRSYGSYSGTRI